MERGGRALCGWLDESIARLRDGGVVLYPPELRYLHDLGAWCRRAIHLQCAAGEDTLSLWNLGAAEVVGVDISDTMIEIARRKSAALGAPARWFACDLLATPHELDGSADLVYTGKGALNWLHDIEGWAQGGGAFAGTRWALLPLRGAPYHLDPRS